MRPGAELFNTGDYWEAHEAWESPWNAAKARGDLIEANYIQGLILLAAAIHKRRHYHSPHGGMLNYAKALRRLQDVSLEYVLQHDGIHLDQLKIDVRHALEDDTLRPQLPL
jgi:hypothetical protein